MFLGPKNAIILSLLPLFFFFFFLLLGFAREDWLHTWCDNRTEEVRWSPTRVCSFRGTTHHWYRGMEQSLVLLHCLFIRLKCCTFIYVFWDWLYEVQSFILWCPNDETIHCCSNLGYTDSLPLRPDWIPFTTMLLPFIPHILNEYFDLTRYTSFSCQPGRFL